MGMMEKAFVQHREMQEAVAYLANQIARRPKSMQIDTPANEMPQNKLAEIQHKFSNVQTNVDALRLQMTHEMAKKRG